MTRDHRVVKAYMEGMNWVLHYYFQGVSESHLEQPRNVAR